MVRDVRELKEHGIGAIAISANDPTQYPDDSFDNMKRLAAEKKLPVPVRVRRDPGGRARVRRGLHARTSSATTATSSCSTAAASTPPRPPRSRARSASSTRPWCRSPRPGAAPSTRSRPWAARSSGRPRERRRLEAALAAAARAAAHLARVSASHTPPPIRQMPLALDTRLTCRRASSVPARRSGPRRRHRRSSRPPSPWRRAARPERHGRRADRRTAG